MNIATIIIMVILISYGIVGIIVGSYKLHILSKIPSLNDDNKVSTVSHISLIVLSILIILVSIYIQFLW